MPPRQTLCQTQTLLLQRQVCLLFFFLLLFMFCEVYLPAVQLCRTFATYGSLWEVSVWEVSVWVKPTDMLLSSPQNRVLMESGAPGARKEFASSCL